MRQFAGPPLAFALEVLGLDTVDPQWALMSFHDMLADWHSMPALNGSVPELFRGSTTTLLEHTLPELLLRLRFCSSILCLGESTTNLLEQAVPALVGGAGFAPGFGGFLDFFKSVPK